MASLQGALLVHHQSESLHSEQDDLSYGLMGHNTVLECTLKHLTKSCTVKQLCYVLCTRNTPALDNDFTHRSHANGL
jgi:hypothetical protein